MDSSIQTLSFELTSRSRRPIFRFDGEAKKVNGFIDSGALTPVWVDTEASLKKTYPSAIKQKDKAVLKGYGQKAETNLPIYTIPYFVLSDGQNKYTIKNLYLVVCSTKRKIGCQFVLSDTMFIHADVEFRRLTNEKCVNIICKNKDYICTPQRIDGTLTTTVWTQL